MITKLFSNTLFLIAFVFFLCLIIGVIAVGSYSGITLDDFCTLVFFSSGPTLLIAVCGVVRWICDL